MQESQCENLLRTYTDSLQSIRRREIGVEDRCEVEKGKRVYMYPYNIPSLLYSALLWKGSNLNKIIQPEKKDQANGG